MGKEYQPQTNNNQEKKVANKQKNIVNKKKMIENIIKAVSPIVFILLLIVIWQIIVSLGKVDEFILPSPKKVAIKMKQNFPLIMKRHFGYTLLSALSGLFFGLIIGFLFALLMDRFNILNLGFRPILVISQTIPSVAIAPLLIIWFGIGLTPKIILVTLTTFFPIAVALADGFRSVSKDQINLLKSMGANKFQVYWYAKFPASQHQFFSAMKISTTYAIVGAVIAEWIAGDKGIGVYISILRKAYGYASIFVAVIIVSVSSLILVGILDVIKFFINKKQGGVYEKF